MISIVIPTYMEEKYIDRSLKSIEKQRFDDYETIIVDSNSSDKTREIAKTYTNKVFNIKERGIGLARNFGAKKAKSNVLLFLDADTALRSKNTLGEISNEFEDSKVVCYSGNVQCLGGEFYRFLYKIANGCSKISVKLNYPLFYGMTIGCRKKDFLKIGGFNENIKICEDMDFSRRIRKLGKCVFEKSIIGYTVPRRLKKMGLKGFFKLYGSSLIKLFFLNKIPKKDPPPTR